MIRRSFSALAATLLMAAIGISASTPASARDTAPTKTKSANTILVSELPKEGRTTLDLIRKGGPFPHAAKDGSIFSNREGILPKEKRGHYREYTVATPGARNRGAKRIVCGGPPKDFAKQTCYFTDDHYATFKKIQN